MLTVRKEVTCLCLTLLTATNVLWHWSTKESKRFSFLVPQKIQKPRQLINFLSTFASYVLRLFLILVFPQLFMFSYNIVDLVWRQIFFLLKWNFKLTNYFQTFLSFKKITIDIKECFKPHLLDGWNIFVVFIVCYHAFLNNSFIVLGHLLT